MSARPFIDSLDFARNARQISDEVRVAELPRLHDVLADTDGTLAYSVRGGLDHQGKPLLDVNVTGSCRLRCQRCLGALEYPVQIEERLMLCSQRELDALDDEEDEFDSILAEAQLDVLDLLEEEILLNLPIAPRHEPGECQAADGKQAITAGNAPQAGVPGASTPQQGGKNPFAVLAKLKRNQ